MIKSFGTKDTKITLLNALFWFKKDGEGVMQGVYFSMAWLAGNIRLNLGDFGERYWATN